MRGVNPQKFKLTGSLPVRRVTCPAASVFLHGVAVALDGEILDDALQIIAIGKLAHAARHGSEFGERVAQHESDHGVVGRAGGEVPGDHAKALGTVKIVGIDGGEWLVDRVGAARMACVVPHGLVRPAGTVKRGGMASSDWKT